VIHHGRQYQVMTNSPVYSEQLKLNAYWSTKDRTHELPGSIQSPDRFVRGSYYVEQLPATSDPRQALEGVIKEGVHSDGTGWDGGGNSSTGRFCSCTTRLIRVDVSWSKAVPRMV